MILYLDTSALVKIYINESHSSVVQKAVLNANIVATHKIGFVEAHATFARLFREKSLETDSYELVKKAFTNDWEDYLRIGVDSVLLQNASEFAEAFALRAYDSVHLATVSCLSKQKHEKITFACFDHRLNQAAKILGLELLKVS